MMRSFTWILPLALVFIAAGAVAADVQVVSDFEDGCSAWYEVDGRADRTQPPLCQMTTVADAHDGIAAARLQFAARPKSWAHMQMSVHPVDWIGSDCDRLSLWLKGDGSGETLNIMFGNYERKPALNYVYPIKLDFTGWKQFTLPFNGFTPTGLPSRLSEIVLIQLNVNDTAKPVDVLIDEILALPADHGTNAGRFYDLDLLTAAGWDLPAPRGRVMVDPLAGMPASTVLPGTLHGNRNHLDLHNPLELSVDYAEAGTFAVKLATSSGYGGAGIVLSVDGQERLRKDFPGETQTELTQYQGYYAVPVPAGKHVIKVDNQGADWVKIDSYRLGNYGRGHLSVSRTDGRLTISVLDADAKGLPDVTVDVRIAGKAVAVVPQADGRLQTAPLREQFPTGKYPVTVTAYRNGKPIYSGSTTLLTAQPRMELVRTAFPSGEDITLAVRYSSAAGTPITGQRLTARIRDAGRPEQQGAEVPLSEQTGGIYSGAVGRLSEGIREISIRSDRAHDYQMRALVYDPKSHEIANTGVIKLGANQRFQTHDGRDWTPWGFATIGMYEPDPEQTRHVAEWAFASDEDVRNWIGLLRCYGINVVRFGVNVGEMKADQGGHLNPDIARRLRHFLDLIEPLGVRAIPVMWWGHYHNFQFEGVKAYDDAISTQADWFTKPSLLELHRQYVREVVAPYVNDPRIFAWEVMNETYPAGNDRQAAIRWTNAVAGAMRSADPSHLITTSACEATPAEEIEWIVGANIDFFNWHAYPTYTDYGEYRKQAGNDTPREIGNYAAVMAIADAGHGKCVLLGETGNDRGAEVDYPEFKTLITRDCLWIAYLCGSPGGISWDAIADPREFDVLSRIASQIDGRRWKPANPQLILDVKDWRKDLGVVARYSWWSLEQGVNWSWQRASPDAPATSTVGFSPPTVAKGALNASDGYQVKCIQLESERALIAYVRNVGGVLPQNVRTRTPRPLKLTINTWPGTLRIWDLDECRVIKTMPYEGETTVNLGMTDHDFAVVVRAK